ncbi:MAG: aconitate hydratase AcnA [Planctomycetota bacterium]
MAQNPFSARATLQVGQRKYQYCSLPALERHGLGRLGQLPFSIRVLLEQALRNLDGYVVTEEDVRNIAGFGPDTAGKVEIPFLPGRVVLQDFTGVPCVVDLAAMRAAMRRLGGDPKQINPLVPCDLVIDHSVQVDAFASSTAEDENLRIEFERNKERYEFLKWGQQSLTNFRAVPPGMGIVHQVNLEYLASVVLQREQDGGVMVYPDSLVGTDSHTTMINGIGVLGWGVGGIEAEAVMLGQPTYMLLPEVVGLELRGRLPEAATATDMVLTITQLLRQNGVVGKFVEFFGDGALAMSLADRATIANMAPEYGATMGFFPVDHEACDYLRRTGRPDELVELVQAYYEAQGMFWTKDSPRPRYSQELSLDLRTVVPSLAGPKRPQDRIELGDMQREFRQALTKEPKQRGFGLGADDIGTVSAVADGSGASLQHGSVVIAAITSCTNTSNPSVMLGAGILAQKAVERGLTRKSWVKTSLAPGSRVVTDYLQKAGLLPALEQLGFHVVGYGCTTCIGNSGPLPQPVAEAVREADLVAAAVLSGNRNFEGRVNPDVKANYLASPPLVVAYALAGTVDIDLQKDPLGIGSDGQPVYLRQIWPTQQEVAAALNRSMSPAAFRREYGTIDQGPPPWRAITARKSDLYSFDDDSTYIQEPPFFLDMERTAGTIAPIDGARVLLLLGDSVTTDHISPAGSIKKDSPAGRYLIEHGVEPRDFNSYGARRGNDRVMTRGTFANIRLRNLLVDVEGGYTRYHATGETMAVYDAAERYRGDGTPLCVLAGKEYGTGSSRDWAAKGTFLLGVKFVLAESYERIHRSNLVGMGVLPLQFLDGESAQTHGLTGAETFAVELDDDVQPRQLLQVTVTEPSGASRTISVRCRIDTPVEVDYYRNGGILQTVLRKLLDAKAGGGARKSRTSEPAVAIARPPKQKAAAKAKAAPKKAATKKAAPKKGPLKKRPVKKSPVKKSPVKKSPVKKAPAKKPAAKKGPAKKGPATRGSAKATKARPTAKAAKKAAPNKPAPKVRAAKKTAAARKPAGKAKSAAKKGRPSQAARKPAAKARSGRKGAAARGKGKR